MRKLFSALPLLFLLVFGMVSQASAQSSWLPTYNASDTVYVAPGVNNALRTAFQSASVASDIRQQAAVHNLNVIVVVTVSGSDAGSDSRQSGPVLVRKLWDSWTSGSSFNKDRALVILLTGDGQNLVSVGVRAGDYLNGLGIVRNTMSDQNGPVIPVLRANLANNPAAVPAGIVERVNAIVSAKVGSAAPVKSDGSGTPITPPASSTSSEGNSSMSLGTILLIVLGGAVLFFVVRAIVKSGSSSSSTPTDSGFQARLDAERRARSAVTSRPSVPPTGGATGTTTDPHATTSPAGSNGVNTALAVGAGVVVGSVLADQMRRRNDEEEADRRRRDDSTTTTTSDSGSVAPVIAPSCSTPSTPSCSSTSSGSSCSSSSGSSCGGGGCGGGS